MKGADYHQELTPIVKLIAQALEKTKGVEENADDVDAEDLQLEFKHGFFKGPNFLLDKKQTVETLSMNKVVILSMNEAFRKIKVNAGCKNLQFDNAYSNLSTIVKNTGCKVEQSCFLFINWSQERFLYDCSLGKWIRVYKNPLLKQQSVASKKKFYRINFSLRKQYIGVEEQVKKFKVKYWLTNNGFMRFKHSLIYHIDSYFFIQCNTLYETELESEYATIEKIIQQDGNLEKIIKQTLEQKKKHCFTKTEIQLKITPKGIDKLREGKVEDQKILISRAFDQLRDITNQPSEQDLARMMANLTLETKEQKKEVEKLQKKQTSQRQKKQTEQDVSEQRREYRKREF